MVCFNNNLKHTTDACKTFSQSINNAEHPPRVLSHINNDRTSTAPKETWCDYEGNGQVL